MAEEELTPTQKLQLAKNFVVNSPPAQTSHVLEDLKVLIGEDVLTEKKRLGFTAQVNKEQFAAVKLGDGKRVLLTPHGELPDGLFLDPSTQSAIVVDHVMLTAEASDKPVDPAQLASMREGTTSAMRAAVDEAMQKYVSSHLPDGVVTTYGTAVAGSRIVCCIAALTHNLENYWAGRWKAEWTLEVPSGGSIGTLTGTVSCHVHYFEDGNVQLDDKVVFQSEIEVKDVGASFAAKVKELDLQFYAKLEEIYGGLSDEVLKNLRRRLPITGQKFDWDKLAVAGLAKEVASLKAS
jgi:capping protein alpha